MKLVGYIGALVIGAALGVSADPVPFTSRHFNVERLADGVYAAINNDDGGWAICNGGIVDLGDRAVVIDPFLTPAAAADLKRAAETLTGHRVALVINTHGHNDHIRGNQMFVPGAEIIGTSIMRNEILTHEPQTIAREKTEVPAELTQVEAELKTATGDQARELRLFQAYFRAILASHEGLVMTPPTIVADQDVTLYGPARRADIRAIGRAHTDSDLVVYLPAERIAFMGDLLFVERHPYLADGSPEDWKRDLRQIRSWDLVKVVPGHGPVATPESLLTMIGYIETLQKIAAAGIAAGQTVEQVSDTPIPAAYAAWMLRPFYKENLAFLARRPK